MRIFKFSLIAAFLGFIFLGLAYAASSRLEEAKSYSFPERLARHYSKVSNHVFQGGPFGAGEMVKFEKSVPLHSLAQPLDTVEIETVALGVEVLPSESDDIDVRVSSNRIDPKDPVMIDTEARGTVRILSHEGDSSLGGSHGWFVFNFDDGGDQHEIKYNILEVRIPKTVRNVRIRTVSGSGRLGAEVTNLRFQSKSGNFDIRPVTSPQNAKDVNPPARVETLNIETISGNLNGPGRFDHLQFNSVSGDVNLSSFDRVLDIDAQTVSGGIAIRSSEKLDARLEISTKSGSIHLDPKVTGLSKAELKKARKMDESKIILGKGTSRIKFHSVSGDLRLRRTKPASLKHDDSSDDDADDSDDSDADETSSADEAAAYENKNDDESSADWNEGSFEKDALIFSKPSEVVLARVTRSADSSFLSCVARIAIQENTRIGATSTIRRCVKIVV